MTNKEFAAFAEIFRVGNDAAREIAAGAVIGYLGGLIRRIAAGIQCSESIGAELYNEGVVAVLNALPDYTEEKGNPKIFFYLQIKHAMMACVAEKIHA